MPPIHEDPTSPPPPSGNETLDEEEAGQPPLNKELFDKIDLLPKVTNISLFDRLS